MLTRKAFVLLFALQAMTFGCSHAETRQPDPPRRVGRRPGRQSSADPQAMVKASEPRSADIVRASAEMPSASDSNDSLNNLRRLREQAVQSYAGIDSYIARLRRREQVKGKDKPEELILFKFRKQPWSVYFKWIGEEAKGREVIYVNGRYEGKIHTLMAAGDMPLAKAGTRIALSHDSIFVRNASRHSIVEAGVGHLVEMFSQFETAKEKGGTPAGRLKYVGLQHRPEFADPLEAVIQTIAPGAEPELPRGGRRQLFFDPTTHLPVLVITSDERGHEVEYNCYDRFQTPVKLDDRDFDPDWLWKKTNTR